MAELAPSIAPYFDLHMRASGPGDQRPTAMQIIQDQHLFGYLGQLTIVVTGGNSGLGRETVKALHTTGARIIIAVAPGVDGKSAAREIEDQNINETRLNEHHVHLRQIEAVTMNLASLASIKTTAAEIRSMTDQVNVLICNAGVMTPNIQQTEDGFEPHFGINYLGHFLLFSELLRSLAKASANTSSFASRVVTLSSLGHRSANVDTDKLPPNIRHEPESRVQNFYSESKTELLWMTNEIERRFGSVGIHGLSVSPGSIATPLTAHIGWDNMRERMGKDIDEFDRLTKDLEQGAATTVWGAVGDELEGKGGFYLDDVQVARAAIEGSPAFTHGYAPWAYDEEKARRLWDVSVNLLKERNFEVTHLM